MANHRAGRRAATRPRSERAHTPYVGKRVAGREPAAPVVPAVDPITPSVVERVPVLPTASPTDTSSTASLRPAVPGKRKAVKKPTSPLRRIPSAPVLVGVATLAVAAGGVLSSPGHELASGSDTRITAPNALTGTSASSVYSSVGRTPTISRDSQRDALEDAADAELVAEAEQQAEQRNVKLGQLAQAAEKEAKTISANAWVLPIAPGGYRLTARYGEYGLWASYHTGLDFAASSGTPIMALAGGTVTETGYDGAYGNKTVITLEDGTEIWYCHQTDYAVSVGDVVRAGEVIGTVGSTGNSTGPHLHLEVRPGGGDPVDPFAAMVVNGVTP